MTKQSEALRLADALEVVSVVGPLNAMRLEEAAALVAAAEREACAKVCDDLLANPHTGGGWSDAMIEAAAAIRSRRTT